ncbi:EamA family transporter [Terasakiella sp. A23]|uniref:aromatic amino acid exporter YddG n=1 Tax=Terasakiella sp. FCG-A23 TaxID=3080561 RepID=UPI002953B675|nr:EamA family transporter [Terasakiella sp. A23]MDV7338074.1 EamA family transporter [Terasakiella sp. A23]
MDSVLRGTLIGAVALFMWSTLGILTVWSGPIPPFQLVASSFFVAFLCAVIKWTVKGETPLSHIYQPPKAWILGVSGLFGYHFLYFLALKSAPAIEANLINYLWPLLIVFFSAFLPGEKLRWYHTLGTLSGLAGTILLVTGGKGFSFEAQYALGYIAAIGCGLVWSTYSVLNRLFGGVPTDAVGWFCLAGSILAAICHFAFETTILPDTTVGWLVLLAMGLGPAGGAFFFWDYGVKHGNIRALGAGSYMIPLASTLLLLLIGEGSLTWAIAGACALISGGAILASSDFLKRK